MQTLDVLVLGGGPAGAATALALKQKGFRTALVEPEPEKAFRVGETVPPAFKQLLQQLQVEHLLSPARHLASLGNQSAWGSDVMGFQDFFFSLAGHGWHLNRVRFEADLLEEACKRGVHFISHFSFYQSEKMEKGGWETTLKSVHASHPIKRIQSNWIIDATGRNARFATSQYAKHVYFDQLVGIGKVSHLADSSAKQLFTLIEARENGWWYQAGLPNQQQITLLMTDSDLCKSHKLFEEEVWLSFLGKSKFIQAELEQHTFAQKNEKLWVVPASTRRISHFSGTQWLAVGDAAFSMDPLSSAGIYKAVHHGLLAASAVQQAETGDSTGIIQYKKLLHSQFENYLSDRKKYYSQEKRWKENPFWRRRHKPISLDPHLILCIAPQQFSSASHHLKYLLPIEDWHLLLQFCQQPIPSHQIIGQFLQKYPSTYSPERLIEALSYLLEKGLLIASVGKVNS